MSPSAERELIVLATEKEVLRSTKKGKKCRSLGIILLAKYADEVCGLRYLRPGMAGKQIRWRKEAETQVEITSTH